MIIYLFGMLLTFLIALPLIRWIEICSDEIVPNYIGIPLVLFLTAFSWSAIFVELILFVMLGILGIADNNIKLSGSWMWLKNRFLDWGK